ncbi:MAG: tRNA pseudouridine(38-40) synthase TruA [Desulfobulbaceae bacterium]|nr:tRNA pseudouridine(38-40) synthase TruA [Desulfobulbaceae bacterium]
MRNIKLTIAFDGTEFSGWQRQSNASTVQGELEKKIALMTGQDVSVHGAGRTDAGVHAVAMTAHFATASTIECMAFKRGLNSLLPSSIKVLRVEDVAHEFHSRISAKAKSYHYFFSTEEVILPYRRLYCAHLPLGFDLDLARQCLQYIGGEHDFSSFEATGSRDKDKEGGRGAVRNVFSVSLDRSQGAATEFLFKICGDGFLRKMVRNIVGSLIEVGQHRMTVDAFARLLWQKDRSLAGPTAPACGLFLQQVYYNEDIIPDYGQQGG